MNFDYHQESIQDDCRDTKKSRDQRTAPAWLPMDRRPVCDDRAVTAEMEEDRDQTPAWLPMNDEPPVSSKRCQHLFLDGFTDDRLKNHKLRTG